MVASSSVGCTGLLEARPLLLVIESGELVLKLLAFCIFTASFKIYLEEELGLDAEMRGVEFRGHRAISQSRCS